MEAEQWEDIINKMVKAFRLYIEEDKTDFDSVQSKNKQKQIKYGMRLFIKYFGHLWY